MSELREQTFSRLLDRSALFLLSFLCLLLYIPSLYHEFIFDDGTLVVENPYIRSWKYLPQMLSKDASNIWDPSNYWRPAFSISLALDYSLWGLTPMGFHLTNVLLHALNSALLFSLGKKLQNASCGVFTSLLFALHPIQAHAINVVSLRADLLAALFALLSVHAFLSSRMILFSIGLTLALLSKETSMVFPLVLFFAWMVLQKNRRDLTLILAFSVLALYLLVRVSLGFSFSMAPLAFSYYGSWDTRSLLAFKVLALYILAIFDLFEVPHPIWMVEVPTSLNDPHVLSGILISLLVLGFIGVSVKRNPVAALGLIWFVSYFLPVSNLKQLNTPMAEHWLYIPMVGLCLAFGAGLERLLCLRLPGAHLVRAGINACIAVFLIFAVLVVREKTNVYHSNESFLLAAIRANPQMARLYSLLASAYLAKQDIPRAREFYAMSVALDPNEIAANYWLGFILHEVGQRNQARIYLERVTRVEPWLKWQFYPVAHAWEMLGDKEKALFYYRKGLEVNPQLARFKEKVAGLEDQLSPGTSPSVPPR